MILQRKQLAKKSENKIVSNESEKLKDIDKSDKQESTIKIEGKT